MLDKKTYRYALVGLSVAVGLFLVGASLIAALGHAVPKELWTIGTALGGGLLGVLIPSPQATVGYNKALAESATAQDSAVKAAVHQAQASPAGTPAAKTSDEETQAQATARVQSKAAAAASEVGNPSNLSQAVASAIPKPGAGGACTALAAQHQQTAEKLTKEAKAPGQSASKRDELNAQASVYSAAATAVQSEATRQQSKAAVKSSANGFSEYFTKLILPLVVGGLGLYLGTRFTARLPTRTDFTFAAKIGEPEAMKQYLQAVSRSQQALIKEGNALLALATAAGGAIVGVLAPSPGQQKTAEPAATS